MSDLYWHKKISELKRKGPVSDFSKYLREEHGVYTNNNEEGFKILALADYLTNYFIKHESYSGNHERQREN